MTAIHSADAVSLLTGSMRPPTGLPAQLPAANPAEADYPTPIVWTVTVYPPLAPAAITNVPVTMLSNARFVIVISPWRADHQETM